MHAVYWPSHNMHAFMRRWKEAVPMLTESSQASSVSVTVNTYTYVRCFRSWFCCRDQKERNILSSYKTNTYLSCQHYSDKTTYYKEWYTACLWVKGLKNMVICKCTLFFECFISLFLLSSSWQLLLQSVLHIFILRFSFMLILLIQVQFNY